MKGEIKHGKTCKLINSGNKNNIINILNESKLHPSILELIMKDIMNDVINASTRIKNKELEEYNNKVIEEAKIIQKMSKHKIMQRIRRNKDGIC